MPVSHLPLKQVDELYTVMLKQGENLRCLRDNDQVWLNQMLAVAYRMPQQPVLVSSPGATPVDHQAFPGTYKRSLPTLLVLSEQCLTGTLSAAATACSVVRDDEVWPFSILDSMPGDRPAWRANTAIGHAKLGPEDPYLLTNSALQSSVTFFFGHPRGDLTLHLPA